MLIIELARIVSLAHNPASSRTLAAMDVQAAPSPKKQKKHSKKHHHKSELALAAAGTKRHLHRNTPRPPKMSLNDVRLAFAVGGAVPRIRKGTRKAILELTQELVKAVVLPCVTEATCSGGMTIQKHHAKNAARQMLRKMVA